VGQDTPRIDGTMRPLAESRKGPAIPLLAVAGFAATMLAGANGWLPWPASIAAFFGYSMLLELLESMQVRKPGYGAPGVQRRNSLLINVPVIGASIAVTLGL